MTDLTRARLEHITAHGIVMNCDVQEILDIDASLRARLEGVERERGAQADIYQKQVEYSAKMQQLVESLRHETTPHEKLYHHTIVVEFKQQLATALDRVRELDEALKSAPTGIRGESHGDVIARYYAWYEGQRKQALTPAAEEVPHE